MIKKQVTIHDIAKHLGVSASTVSRALADHPRIGQKTKADVLLAAKELDYKPNKIAASLRRGTGDTIGVVIPIINRHFFANIIYGIERIAVEHDFSVIICQSDEKLSNEIRNIQTLIKNRVSGILVSVSSQTINDKHFDSITQSNIPVVMFDRSLEKSGFNKVINDDFEGGYLATKHLVEEGYKRIVHYGGPLGIVSYQQRFEGYKKALREAKIKLDNKLVFEPVISKEAGYSKTYDILRNKLGFDAIFAASDMSALGALLCLKEQKIPVPQEIGLIGYVNEPFTEFLEPSLSSVEQYGSKIGETAAKLLFEQINKSDSSIPTLKTISPKLIIRQSSKKQSNQ